MSIKIESLNLIVKFCNEKKSFKTQMLKAAHLTSVHPRFDTRIFLKECCSLASAGYQVSLVVADGKGGEVKESVAISDVGASRGRVDRMINVTKRMFEKAKELDSDIYHLHDPELIPSGLKLKRLGKKVIFDAHEDAPKQLLAKPYLNPTLLRLIASALSVYEHYACSKLDGIITATPFIRDKFLKVNPNTLDINNFPLIAEFDSAVPWADKHNEVCYVGGITAIRGICEVVQACEMLKSSTQLNLVGNFVESEVEATVKSYSGWCKVNEMGFLDRQGVRTVLGRSLAGLVTFLPQTNHINAQPNKMFEYMSSSIPVIASNFQLWCEIVEGNECGLCVDPLDPKAIAQAIDYIVRNPDIASSMGKNGRQAVLNKYNWAIEEQKLLNFYSQIIEKEAQ